MVIDTSLFNISDVVIGRIVHFAEESGKYGPRVVLRLVTDGGDLIVDYMPRAQSPRTKYMRFVTELRNVCGPELSNVGELCLQFKLTQLGDTALWLPVSVVEPPYVDPLDERIADVLAPLGAIRADQEAIYGLLVTANVPGTEELAAFMRQFRNYGYRAVAIRLADLEITPDEPRGYVMWRERQAQTAVEKVQW